MKYEFMADDGDSIEFEFDAIDVPNRIEINGKVFEAKFGATPCRGIPGQINLSEKHIAYTLPRLWQEPALAEVWDKFGPRGHVLVEGKRDREELQARMNAHPKFAGYVWNQ